MKHNKELMIDRSVNKKCLERVQGLLSQYTISEVRNCLNHLNADTEWLTSHIAVHDPVSVETPNKGVIEELSGPFGRPL